MLRIVGGHLALDLVNTVEPRVPGASEFREHLGSPTDLLDWGLRAGLLDSVEAASVREAWRASPNAGPQALHATHEVREATYDVLLAVLHAQTDSAQTGATRTAVAPQLDALAVRWSAATARSSLALTGPAVRLDVGTNPATLVQDRLVTAAVDLLRAVDPRQLRTCPLEEGGCGWLFLDQSRNGSRRWCSMDDCGALAKSRRLTARRRATRSATA